MTAFFARYLSDDRGNTTAEYAIVMTVFAISLIGVFQLFLGESGTQLTSTQNNLQSTAMAAPSPPAGT